MAEYQFEAKLRNRAAEFIRELDAAGFHGSIVDDSARDYAIKVSVSKKGQDFGPVVIYHSPKSDAFSMKTHELRDKSIAPTLQDCWNGERRDIPRSGSAYEVYVDGSYINGSTGYGAVILANGKVVEELSGPVDSAEVNGTRQVAGELAAVKAALNWCFANSVNEVSIYYDYLGIEKWATGRWKTNQPLTRDYARFVAQCPVRIRWHKVDSHTGDRWNDRADALAKQGAGSIQNAKGRRAIPEPDLVSELIEKTDAWIEFLMVKGIEATFDRVYNEQFARVYIVERDEPVGTFDLYNTKKKRFSPYLHNFRDEGLKGQLERLWRNFQSSANEDSA